VPFISVRFSSENYASITFWAAVFFVLDFYKHIPRQSNYKLILAGVLLGLSFFFRFQMAFAMAGLGLWMLLVQKANWKDILMLVFPALMVMLICVGIDTWFYEETVFTPFNYFYQNIVENRAAEFGETPWWDYFKLFIEKAIPPFSLIFLILFFVGGYRFLIVRFGPESVFDLTLSEIPCVFRHRFYRWLKRRFPPKCFPSREMPHRLIR
jgi:phosphatidylinositol glycan class B